MPIHVSKEATNPGFKEQDLGRNARFHSKSPRKTFQQKPQSTAGYSLLRNGLKFRGMCVLPSWHHPIKISHQWKQSYGLSNLGDYSQRPAPWNPSFQIWHTHYIMYFSYHRCRPVTVMVPCCHLFWLELRALPAGWADSFGSSWPPWWPLGLLLKRSFARWIMGRIPIGGCSRRNDNEGGGANYWQRLPSLPHRSPKPSAKFLAPYTLRQVLSIPAPSVTGAWGGVSLSVLVQSEPSKLYLIHTIMPEEVPKKMHLTSER